MAENNQEMHENLERGLKNRHIQLIGLGGAIGVGLFLGSATAIELAGPSVLLTYIIGGVAIYFIMRALGELFELFAFINFSAFTVASCALESSA